MPFLDAKALHTDQDGMAFLRSVIRPTFEQEEATSIREGGSESLELLTPPAPPPLEAQAAPAPVAVPEAAF
jgi:hypothetical protein